eukprot:scaffold228_cov437-Pavlova_lutheri.AAC.1
MELRCNIICGGGEREHNNVPQRSAQRSRAPRRHERTSERARTHADATTSNAGPPREKEEGAQAPHLLKSDDLGIVYLRPGKRTVPRQEFEAANTYFGQNKKILTQAYLDTLASYCFISDDLFRKLQKEDPDGYTWKTTENYFDFSVAVGEDVHRAPVIKATITMDGFKTTLHFGVAPLGTFDCILGASFCAAHLVGLDWPNHRMKLRHAVDRVHSVHRDRNFISQRKLDLVVPRSEVRRAVQQP